MTLSDFFNRAQAAHRAGRLLEAEGDYRAMLEAEPDHVDALHWLGVLHHQRGEHQRAAELVGRAATLRPGDAGVQLNLGTVLRALGRVGDAIERFRNALHLQPDFALAHYNLGNAYAVVQRHADAADSFRRVIGLQPRDVRARVNLATSLIALEHHAAALDTLHEALRLAPHHAGAHNNLGMALNGLGRPLEALEAFRASLELEPRYVAAHFNLANTLVSLQRHAQAIDAYRAALQLQPRFAAALHGLGNACAALGRHEDAARSLECAVGIEPHAAPCWVALGNIRAAQAQHEAAARAYEQALRLRPDLASVHLNLAMMYLTRRDFARGWRAYEWRHATLATPHTIDLPRWHGDVPLTGQTLLVHAEQGLGDTLHFVRYVPRLVPLAAHVVLQVQVELARLLEPFCARHRITLVHDGTRLPPCDCYVPLLSLPRVLNLDDQTLHEASVPYLQAPLAYQHKWQGRLTRHAPSRIGLAWSGRIQPNETRAVPFDVLKPLLALPQIDWFVLQRDWTRADLDAFNAMQATHVHRLDAAIGDFADTAAIIEQLDAVVSVDTSIAHLAGALGAPLWLMLPFAADWRWFEDPHHTPWYPRARLVRQRVAGQWDDVVSRVRDEIAATTARTHA
jgi:tetratricopeptide (TPR) repeat protein